jgi:hypothetical protein
MGESKRKKILKEDLPMKCEDCEYWIVREDLLDGECRKSPPVPLVVPMSQTIVGKQGPMSAMGIQFYFPRTRAEIFCGAFKVRQQ